MNEKNRTIQGLAVLLDEIEHLIQGSDLSSAKKILREFQSQYPGWPPQELPRPFWAKLASLFRRTSEPTLALRLLHAVVRPRSARDATIAIQGAATSDEKLEYALALLDLGLDTEATEIIRSVEEREVARAYFVGATREFKRWNFHDAIPLLRRYLSCRLKPHEIRQGQLNLFLALLREGQTQEAEMLLQELTPQGQLAADLSRELHRGTLNADELDKIRAEAIVAHDFEAVRRADFDLAMATMTTTSATVRENGKSTGLTYSREALARIQNLFFGTPYPALRNRIREKFPQQLEAARKSELWIWPSTAVADASVIDVRFDHMRALIEAKGHETLKLKPGQLLHRVLIMLTSDAYRPFSASRLFGALFPNRQYHWRSSPLVVHQAIFRLRGDLKKAGLPLSLEHGDSGFWIAVAPKYRLVLTGLQEAVAEDASVRALNAFILQWKEWATSAEVHEPVAVRNLASGLGLPLRSAQRLVNQGVVAGTIVRHGTGPKVRYAAK